MDNLNPNINYDKIVDSYSPEKLLKSLQEYNTENQQFELYTTLALNNLLNNIRAKVVKCNICIALSSKVCNENHYQEELQYIKDELLPLCFNSLKTLRYCKDTEALFHSFTYECKDLQRYFSNDIKIKELILEIEKMISIY